MSREKLIYRTSLPFSSAISPKKGEISPSCRPEIEERIRMEHRLGLGSKQLPLMPQSAQSAQRTPDPGSALSFSVCSVVSVAEVYTKKENGKVI